MKKSLIYLSLSVFLTVSAFTAVIAFSQQTYIAIAGWGFAAVGSVFLYCGLNGIICRIEQDNKAKQDSDVQNQKRLIQALADLRSTSDTQCVQLLQEQKNISATVKNIHEVQKERLCQIQKSVDEQNCSLKEKLTSIHNDIRIAADYLMQIHSLLVDPENPELHLIPLLSDSFQKLPSRIYGAQKDQLCQIQNTIDAQSSSIQENLSAIIDDLDTTADYLFQIHNLLVDPENPELHFIPLLSDSFQKLPSRIYGQEKEQLRQLKQSMDTVNAQLIALEESLLKYMGDYQAYMERFSQLSQQDNQILNRLLENDDVQ